MATYRSNATTSEKPILSPAQGGTAPTSSDTSPAVPSDVIYKLLGFTFAMMFFPIGSYFFTLNIVFNGEFHTSEYDHGDRGNLGLKMSPHFS